MRESSSLRAPRADLPGAAIERDVGEAQDAAVVGLGRLRPPQQRAQARLQLLERERLDEVVVGARVEPGDPVVDRVAGGEHQHRRAVAGVAQAAADLQAVDPGHRDVEHDRVVAHLGHAVERLAAVGRQFDVVAVQAQCAVERGPHRGLVVDDQHARHFRGFSIGSEGKNHRRRALL